MNIVSGALIYDMKKKINLSNPKRPSWSQSLDAHCESSGGEKVLKRDKYRFSIRRQMYVIKRNVSQNSKAVCQQSQLTDGREEVKMFYHVRQGVLFEI